MSLATKRAIVFLGVIVVCCFLAWLGGYNFDQRGEGVAFAAVWGIGFAAFVALIGVPDDR